MGDKNKSKAQLIKELVELRQRITETETLDRKPGQIEETLHLLRKAVETIPIGITITDTESKIVYSNPAEAKIHGYDAEEIIGKSTRIFAPPEQWEPISFNELRGLKRWNRESLNIKKNGEIFPVYLISVPVTDVDGNPVGIITTCEDITERKHAEKFLIQRQKALQAVYKTATTLHSSYEEARDQIVLNLSKLLGVSHVAVQYIEGDQIRVISRITDGKNTHNEVTPLEGSPCALVYEKKETYQINGPLQQFFPQNMFISNLLAEFHGLARG